MTINNPVSKTHFKITSDRLQHFTNETFMCDDCQYDYHPKVHSQPYIVQFGAILIATSLFLVFKFQAPVWLYALLPILIGGYMIWYHNRDRRIMASSSTSKLKYGDIILECPKCGSTKATKVG
ncbi:hypothetical protein [Gimesia chilikensis]|uniref:hypothetical protein n=1 Tax=Gimesia chilikensis TaxID=2605989 RepID=UPI0011A19421|nr:hypothetical protein [Gimesia chilikensis]